MGIRTKITAGMLVAALLPLLLFWGISYSDTRTRVQQEVRTRLASVAGQHALHVDDWIDNTLRGMKLAASNPALADLDPATARTATQKLVSNYPWLVAAFVAQSQDGQQIARSNDEALSNIANRDYFKSAINGQITTQVAISKANNQPVLLSGAPIMGKTSASGVLGISAELASISNLVVADKVGATGFSFLMDETGRLIAHPDKAVINAAMAGGGSTFIQHPAVQALAGGNTSFASFDKDNKKWVAAAAKTKTGWIMVTQMQADEAYAPMQAVNIKALLTLVGATVLALVFSLLLGKKLAAPIVSLTHAADHISKGQFDEKLLDGIAPGDEIGDLAAAVKRLSASVKLAMDMLSKAE